MCIISQLKQGNTLSTGLTDSSLSLFLLTRARVNPQKYKPCLVTPLLKTFQRYPITGRVISLYHGLQDPQVLAHSQTSPIAILLFKHSVTPFLILQLLTSTSLILYLQRIPLFRRLHPYTCLDGCLSLASQLKCNLHIRDCCQRQLLTPPYPEQPPASPSQSPNQLHFLLCTYQSVKFFLFLNTLIFCLLIPRI